MMTTNNDDYKFRECMEQINYINLYNSIYSALYCKFPIEIHLIQLIADYSLGIIIQCSNTTKPCSEEIYFDSQFEMERNLKSSIKYLSSYERHERDSDRDRDWDESAKPKIYQYCAQYIHQGTNRIYGKNRRIFCEQCTNEELEECTWCYQFEAKRYDADQNEMVEIICHNHNYIECNICKQEFDEGIYGEIIDCKVCGNKHCKKCDMIHCVKCKDCQHSFCSDCGGVIDCDGCGGSVCNDCFGEIGGIKFCGDCLSEVVQGPWSEIKKKYGGRIC